MLVSIRQECAQAPARDFFLIVLRCMLRRVCMQVITRNASTRVAEYAFKYARDNGRKRVNSIHKANIMKMADGLFIKCCREVRYRLETKLLLQIF